MILPRAPTFRPTLRRWLLATGLAATTAGIGPGRAADVAAPAEVPAPFVAGPAEAHPGEVVMAGILAEAAQEAGLHHLAVRFYRQALAPEAALEPARRRELALALTTSLLALRRTDEALAELEAMSGEPDARWELRRAIVSFQRGENDEAATRVEPLRVRQLPAEDVAWLHFLRAMLATLARDRGEAEEEFGDAIAASTSAAATAWFHVAEYQVRLNADEISEPWLRQVEKTMRDFEGRRLGFETALQYATALDRMGRRNEAVEVLARQRRSLPASEVELRDKTLLLLGLIAGVDARDGYNAMLTLLEDGRDVNWQRIALQRLAQAADAGTEPARTGVPRLLSELADRRPPHPLREDLLYYRAALALRPPAPNLDQAEADATMLLAEFPGTALRANALALLASSSWQRERFRTAADFIMRLRGEVTDESRRVRLAVLAAECHFNAGRDARLAEDFRNAASAYAQAQEGMEKIIQEAGEADGKARAREAAGIAIDAVFFHRVLALLHSGDLDEATALLESPAAEGISANERWRAVWNNVRFLQQADRSDEAFANLEKWGATENAPAELNLRFLWLLAQLSLETGQPRETLNRVAAIRTFLSGAAGAEVAAAERAQVESSTALLEAQALLDDGRHDAGLAAMDQLRRTFPASNAAIFSYIVQARYLSAEGQLVEAQKLLRDLADKYPDSEYAPRALFEAAEQAKKRGADAYLEEAKELLEKLATEYKDSPFVFLARLEQGDILRKLNQFAAAEQVYLLLENSDAPSPEYRNIAQLSLADTLMAQIDNDPAKFEAAISRLEILTDLPSPADPDLRVEAGFKLGYGYQKKGDGERAADVYWDLYVRLLLDAGPGERLGSNGRYWMARALLELAEIKVRAGQREEAFRAYQAILDHGLPGRDVVQGRLDALRAGG
jgi:TolA-binding protein